MIEAYGIELLRANSIEWASVKQQFEQNQWTFHNIEQNFDFSALQNLFEEDRYQFEQAFQGNYEVKFLTINGLRNILRLRFGITENGYTMLEQGNGLSNITASEEIERQIRSILSKNWKVERNGMTITLYV